MAGLTQDVHAYPYGTDGGLASWPVAANQTCYVGGVALQSGGTGATQGYLKNGDTSVSATDTVVGMLEGPEVATGAQTGPGVVGGTTDGAVWASVREGTFFFQSGTGADTLSAATNGTTVYYGGENATGPIACKTSGSSTRPVLGVQVPQDPGIAGGFSPGASYWPIKLTTIPSIP
jgi:hypothetical protein